VFGSACTKNRSLAGGRANGGVNRKKPDLWKADILRSVDMYNAWFMKFAPAAYRETRIQTTKDVESTLKNTQNLADVSATLLQKEPGVLPTLRMSTCPPLAVDRLVGLAGVSKTLVSSMEEGRIPPRMAPDALEGQLKSIGVIIEKLADLDIFVWLGRLAVATEVEIHRAMTIVADRLCGSVANPIIRNAQEKRQLAAIEAWLQTRGYQRLPPKVRFAALPQATGGTGTS
jgi:XamI restriction endonuclease